MTHAPGTADRRRTPRRVPEAAEPLSRVRLRTGSDMAIVDVSDYGALLEGAARLLPGTHVDAHVITHEGRVLVRSRVVRAYVCHLARDVVRYRGAVAFEQRVDTSAPGYELPGPIAENATPLGSSYPASVAGAIDVAGQAP